MIITLFFSAKWTTTSLTMIFSLMIFLNGKTPTPTLPTWMQSSTALKTFWKYQSPPWSKEPSLFFQLQQYFLHCRHQPSHPRDQNLQSLLQSFSPSLTLLRQCSLLPLLLRMRRPRRQRELYYQHHLKKNLQLDLVQQGLLMQRNYPSNVHLKINQKEKMQKKTQRKQKKMTMTTHLLQRDQN